MRHRLAGFLAVSIAFAFNLAYADDSSDSLSVIAFGSCADQTEPQPIWRDILEDRPDVFVFLGDNVYADTANMDEMRRQYEAFGSIPGVQQLFDTTRVLATWDDHDYGLDDAGAEFGKKEESKAIFLRFFREPQDSERWERPGIYAAYEFGPPGRRVQIILLDLRSFRSPLVRNPEARNDNYEIPRYLPDDRQDADMLGGAQWRWLEKQLRKPADLRIIGSSVQFAAEGHGWESWANMPRRRTQLFRLISRTGAEGVLFISGDMHYGELSRQDDSVPYPIYDFTSSGLNKIWEHPEENRHRIAGPIRQHNYGLIEIDWEGRVPEFTMTLKGLRGERFFRHTVDLNELRPHSRKDDSG